MEKTLVIIKPDAVNRKKIGRIIGIYEENGLVIEGIYMTIADREILEKHYEEHIGRDFYESLLEFMMSDRIVVLKITGSNAIERVREINGATNPAKARLGTIRYLYGNTVQQNAVHGAADKEAAAREVSIWFGDSID